MPGATSNLPRWLLLLLVLGVFGGQWHQLTCRISGHGATVSVADAGAPSNPVPEGVGNGPSDHDEDGGGCPFHCQFSVSIPCGLTPYASPVPAWSVAVLHGRADHAPESRLVAIEHPPQLA